MAASTNSLREMREMLVSLHKDIWVISVAAFFNRSAGFLALFAAIYFSDLGLSPGGIVQALFAVGVAGVLGSIVGGHLSKPLGEMRVLVLSTLLNIPILLALALLVGNAWSVALAAISVGLSQAFMPPSASLISRYSHTGNRVTMFAFFRIFVNVGSVVAPAVAGYLGQHAFQLLFLISAITSAVSCSILFLNHRKALIRERTEQLGDGDGDVGGGGTASAPPVHTYENIGLPRVVVLLFVMGLTMAIYAQHQSTLPIHLYNGVDGMRLFSQLLILNPTLVILLEFPLSFVSRKFSWPISLGFGVAIMGVGLSISGIATPVAAVFLGYTLFTIGECLFAPMANSAMASLVPADQVSKYQGYLSAVQALGAAMGPAAGLGLFFWRPDLFWWFLIGLSILAGLVVVALGAFRKTIPTSAPQSAADVRAPEPAVDHQ